MVNNCVIDIRGDETLEEWSENLTLTDLGAESQQNLSCAGVNLVGEGDQDEIELFVYGGKKYHIKYFQSKFLFNVGLGAYFSSEKFYLGFSIPGMIEENIEFVPYELG